MPGASCQKSASAQSAGYWRYFGFVPFNGVSRRCRGRRAGFYVIGVGNGAVRRFALCERIRINENMEFEILPGRELAPRSKPAEMWGLIFFSCFRVREGQSRHQSRSRPSMWARVVHRLHICTHGPDTPHAIAGAI